MAKSGSKYGELDWSGDYSTPSDRGNPYWGMRSLRECYSERSFYEAVRDFVEVTGLGSDYPEIGAEANQDPVDIETLRKHAVARVAELVPLSSVKPDGSSDIDSFVVDGRAQRWIEETSGILDSRFVGEARKHSGAMNKLLYGLSRNLPAYSLESLDTRRTKIQALSESGGIRGLYYLAMLAFLMAPRFSARLYGVLRNPVVRDDMVDPRRACNSEMISIMGASLAAFQKNASHTGANPFPIEGFSSQDPSKLGTFVRAEARLVLGQEPNFSGVLQEDLVSLEARELGGRYGFHKNALIHMHMRDLRARVFAHQVLGAMMTAPHELAYPIAGLIPEGTQCMLDLGAGEYAWAANLFAAAMRQMEVVAWDRVYAYQSRRNNLSFRPINLDDMEQIGWLFNEFRGRVGFVLASNIFHKLKDPKKVFEQIIRLLAESRGVMYMVAPAFSKDDPEGLPMVTEQDWTRHVASVWTLEKIFEMVRMFSGQYGVRIRALSHVWPVCGQNDYYHRVAIGISTGN